MKEAIVVVDVEDTVTSAPKAAWITSQRNCLFVILRVCYSVPMGSRCQNSGVVSGLTGGRLMQITRGCIGKVGWWVLRYGYVYVWKKTC